MFYTFFPKNEKCDSFLFSTTYCFMFLSGGNISMKTRDSIESADGISPVSIAVHLPQLDRIEALLISRLVATQVQGWHTQRQAWTAKFGDTPGGVSYNTLRNCPAMQPHGGIPDGWQSGRKVWSTETVEEWIKVDDSGLQAYLDRVCPGRKAPARIMSRLARRGGTI
jgi:hypothetical protein